MKGILNTSGVAELSKREREVVKLASDGHTDQGICRILGISVGTLGTYWARIRQKTGYASRSETTAAFARYKCESVIIRTVALIADRCVASGYVAESGRTALRDLFDALPLAGAIVNEDSLLLLANQQFARVLGRRPETGENLLSTFTSDADIWLDKLADAMEAPAPSRFCLALGPAPCRALLKRLDAEPSTMLLLVSEPECSLSAAVTVAD